MAVTITRDSIIFSFNEGDVSNIKSTITSGVENNPLTLSGPAGSYNYDYDGCTKNIVITGNLTLADTTRTSTGTIKTILEQKNWLESLINGNQTSTTFTSTYETTSVDSSSGISPYLGSFVNTIGMIVNMTFDEGAGNPNELPFNINIVVGN